MRILAVLGAAAALAACAADPKTIEAAYVSTGKYDGWSCAAIVRELYVIEPRLAAQVKAQSTRRTQDAWSAFLIGVTPTLFSPDNDREYEISQLKGERDALRAEGSQKGCTLPEPPPAQREATPPPKPAGQA